MARKKRNESGTRVSKGGQSARGSETPQQERMESRKAGPQTAKSASRGKGAAIASFGGGSHTKAMRGG